MGNQEIKPSGTNPAPKWDIPEVWAKNGRCPACGAANLKVTHLPDLADYLACTHCEISFEVEDRGSKIRLKYIPDRYEFADAILHNHWVDASGLAGILSRQQRVVQGIVQNKESTPVQKHVIDEEEAWSRALGMYRMGNKPKMIQLTLVQAGVTRERAEGVFEKLKKLAEQEAQRQNQKFLTMAGISIFLLMIMAGSWLYMSGNLSILLGITTPTPASLAKQPSAVDRLLDLVPDDAKPALMNLPDTTVDTRSGPGISSCPARPIDAARLFGGSSDLWKRDGEFPSWQMMSANKSITVLVPKGMTAGYVDNKSYQFLSVRGPATIYNANFVVIACD